jgi:putative ABC transport system permease protein
MMANGFKVMILITVIILVIVMTSIFNTMNVNLSSLEQRRNEFAQLRAIGMTQKSLLKTVVLEGGIVWIVSCVLGVVLGLVVEIALYKVLFSFVYSGGIHVAWLAIIITVVLEFIVLCGTNIKFFKDMQLNIAEELMRNGDGG